MLRQLEQRVARLEAMPVSPRTALRAPSHPATQAARIFRLVPSGSFISGTEWYAR